MTAVCVPRPCHSGGNVEPWSRRAHAQQDQSYSQQVHLHAEHVAGQLAGPGLARWAQQPSLRLADDRTQEALLLLLEDVWHREGQDILGRRRFRGRNVSRELDRIEIQARAVTYVLQDYRRELAQGDPTARTTAMVRDFLCRQIDRSAAAQAAQRRRAEQGFLTTGWGDPRRPDSLDGFLENQRPGCSVDEYIGKVVKPTVMSLCTAVTPPAPEPGTAAAREAGAPEPQDATDPNTLPDHLDPLDKLIRVEQAQQLDQAIDQMARHRDPLWRKRAQVLKTALAILRGGFVWPATSRKTNRHRPLVPPDFRTQLKRSAGTPRRDQFRQLVAPLAPWLLARLAGAAAP